MKCSLCGPALRIQNGCAVVCILYSLCVNIDAEYCIHIGVAKADVECYALEQLFGEGIAVNGAVVVIVAVRIGPIGGVVIEGDVVG